MTKRLIDIKKHYIALSMQIERIQSEMDRMDKYNLDNDDIVKSCVEELINIYNTQIIRFKIDNKLK